MISPDLLLTIRNNPEILVDIPNDQTLYKLCSVNNEMRALCEHVDLWEQRYRKYYPQFLDVKLKTNLSWKDAYQITSRIRHAQYLYLMVVKGFPNKFPEEVRNLEEFEDFNGLDYNINFILSPDGRISDDIDLASLYEHIGEVLATLNLDIQYYREFLDNKYYDDIGLDLPEKTMIWNACIQKASMLGKIELVKELANYMAMYVIDLGS